MVDIGGTNNSRRTGSFCAKCGFCLAWEGADAVEYFMIGLAFERVFCFLEIGSSRAEEPDSSRFLGTEANEGVSRSGSSVVVIMEELNLEGVSDPRSTTSCGLVHFE